MRRALTKPPTWLLSENMSSLSLSQLADLKTASSLPAPGAPLDSKPARLRWSLSLLLADWPPDLLSLASSVMRTLLESLSSSSSLSSSTSLIGEVKRFLLLRSLFSFSPLDSDCSVRILFYRNWVNFAELGLVKPAFGRVNLSLTLSSSTKQSLKSCKFATAGVEQ